MKILRVKQQDGTIVDIPFGVSANTGSDADIATHNTDASAHSDIRNAIAELENTVDGITVPTKLSELSDDTTHRLVTDTEKSTWNAKADKSQGIFYIEGDSNIYVTTGNVLYSAKGFSGNLTGNADTATKATQDASGNVITSTYATKTEVSTHNTDTTAHSDIRNAIAELENTVDGITVPTKLSALSDDATHRLVTDTEKSTWNAKADASDVDELKAYIDDELTKRGQLKPEFANSIEECIDTTKLYVLPDGYFYAYMYKDVIEGGYTNKAEPLPNNTTDTSKWVNGYRITSSTISAQAGTTISNSIACKEGDTIRIKGVSLRSNTDRFQVAYTKADGSKAYEYNYWNATGNLFSCAESNGVYVVTMKEHTDYTTTALRFAMPTPADANSVIITVNEEIVEPTITKEYAWANTHHAFVPNNYDDDFVEINEKINETNNDVIELKNENTAIKKSIEELETKIENVDITEIPDYWQEHIDEKTATIKNLHKQYGKDCFSFVVLADTHYPANLGKISPLLAKKVMDEADIKYALHCGDWQTRSCHKTKEALLEENEKIEAMFAPIRDRLLIQQGNHEGAYGLLDRDGDGEYINQDGNGNNKPPAERESYVHNVTPQEMYEFLYRKVGMIGNVHFDDTGTAYYIDDTSNNVRYIGLNTQCNDYELQADGTQKYPTMWIMRFSKAQFDFLINEALVEGVTNRTKIVIFGHVPLTQEIIERELMIGVLNAFKNKTTYSGSCAGEYGYDAVSVNADFTNAKGTLVGYFHGHIHSDSLNTENGFNIIGTRSDAREEYTEEMRNERVAGTTTEQSFNVFTVTPAKIYATKIGAGVDREISY